MRPAIPRPLLLVFALLAVPAAAALGGSRQAEAVARQAEVDRIFSTFTDSTPGCAVGVSRAGSVVLEKAYGLADLEHQVANAAGTIFEAGSIAKQVTAAAILLLARERRLSLDEPLRKHLPELPDYGAPLTLRHALTHTAGLRDWGEIAAIGGWPRGSRAHNQAHVLEIAARQRSLNFTPGTDWSYSNTGYNLAAIVVSRVAGKPFAEFCRERLFEPLGMKHTSWRDDFTAVVRGRAVAYGQEKDGFHSRMPFEDAHGNGGLLTTAGDLLRWNGRFDSPEPGDEAMVLEQQQPAKLATGETLGYALGLFVGKHNGFSEVAHGGATGGYEAFLARYPEQRLSVAVLCNVSSARAEARARAVADLFLPARETKRASGAAEPPARAFLDAWAGLYTNPATGRSLGFLRDGDALRVDGGERLVPSGHGRFVLPGGGEVQFERLSEVLVRRGDEPARRYERVERARPSASEMRELTGVYVSEEAEAAYGVVVQGGELRLWRRPNLLLKARPTYADAFDVVGLGEVRFVREGGRVAAMIISGQRVWNLRLQRVE